jgi:excinuclease ABC subunit A
VKKLIRVLDDLVAMGNTVVVIEHNLDVIKSADHIIDLGPEGGDKGGEIIRRDTNRRRIAKNKKSYTGEFLMKCWGVDGENKNHLLNQFFELISLYK